MLEVFGIPCLVNLCLLVSIKECRRAVVIVVVVVVDVVLTNFMNL